MGVTIRHWFNTHHARKGNPHWTWIATVLLFLAIVWLSSLRPAPVEAHAALPPSAHRFAVAEGFTEVTDIVASRCAMCHAAEPAYDGIHWAPKGLRLETPEQIALEARRIYVQAGLTHTMPPANASFMEPAERERIIAWYRAATGARG